MRPVSASYPCTQMVHELEHELEEKFKLAHVPEPKESAQYIIAHALGHKTVSLCLKKVICNNLHNFRLVVSMN